MPGGVLQLTFMEFSRKKLPVEKISELYSIPIEEIRPYALMFGPAYILLEENEKLVSVKAPLDFFIESDLTQLKQFKLFYFPKTVYQALPYQDAARKIRQIFAWEKRMRGYPEPSFSPAPFEVSDFVLHLVGPLWWKYNKLGPGIESFFVTVLVNELCDLFSPEHLRLKRENHYQAEKFDHALFLASWVVFFALHLGYFDLLFLNQLRDQVFCDSILATPPHILGPHFSELGDVTLVMDELLKKFPNGPISHQLLRNRSETVFRKLDSRFLRIEKEFARRGASRPSVYGPKGFIDG